MTFTKSQIEALSAKLDPAHVKSRSQSGRSLSYVEGWHAIAEANRIFGFDGWTRETFEIKCVAERERKLSSGADAWGVTYIARVRVRVDDIVREGCGTGHGIDRDLGQAHESALKEAETDAMKRALMTFGNPFGLALYDKEQTQVGCAEKPSRAVPERSANFVESVAAVIGEMKQRGTATALKAWGNDPRNKARIAALLDEEQARVRAEYAAHMDTVSNLVAAG